MNKQKEREQAWHKRWIDGYEHNLALLLDTHKNELNDINKDKILQHSIAKTLLWINVVFAGISIKLLEYHPHIWLFGIFVLVSSVGIMLTFFGLLEGKYSLYASGGMVSDYAKLPNDQWVKTQGLLANIFAYRRAIKYNGINLIKRSRWIRRAKYAAVASFVVLLLLGVDALYFNTKGSHMANKPKQPEKSIVRPTPGKRSNASQNKPQKPPRPPKSDK